jgi:hypothetical protein
MTAYGTQSGRSQNERIWNAFDREPQVEQARPWV